MMSSILAKLFKSLKLYKLYTKLAFYIDFIPDIGAEYAIKNVEMLRKKKGYFITRQGYKLFFNEKTKPYILDLYLFHIAEGV